jgi:hypothetical protein
MKTGHCNFKVVINGRDSSVGIAMGCRLDGRGSIPPGQDFVFFTASRSVLGPTYPMGTVGDFQGDKAARA